MYVQTKVRMDEQKFVWTTDWPLVMHTGGREGEGGPKLRHPIDRVARCDCALSDEGVAVFFELGEFFVNIWDLQAHAGLRERGNSSNGLQCVKGDEALGIFIEEQFTEVFDTPVLRGDFLGIIFDVNIHECARSGSLNLPLVVRE